ncbi:hypothetical protein [Paenibacillus taichungensis]|uniref:hypothetical protein n=1 Tax=Paenibacillus taichungensis TaxID=484184 RepID=UPI0038CFB91D
MKRNVIILLLSVIIILVGIYWYADRELISLKTESTLPLQWEDPYNNHEEPIQLTDQNQTLSDSKVHLTKLYYLPNSKKLQFGLWYSKREYQPNPSKKIPDRIFQVTIRDKNGQLYDQDTIVKAEGLFDEFQRRSISIDLDNQESIELTISLIEQNGTTVTPMESTTINVPLDKIKQ